jgi:hypothetical protein
MICKLCGKDSVLRESHIIPKFAFRWLKESGGKYIRRAENPNKRVEDGIKAPLLCNSCEQLFSKFEDKFARLIFYPYSNGDNSLEFQYDKDLMKFAISVLYRILLMNIVKHIQREEPHIDELLQAKQEWNNYLLNDIALCEYNKIHIFFTSSKLKEKKMPVKHFLNYYSRFIDGTLVFSNKACFVYAKLARIILIGEIKGFDSSSMKHTLIDSNQGMLDVNQMQLSHMVKEFLINRTKEINRYLDQASEKQKGIAIENTNKEIGNLLYRDVFQVSQFEDAATIDENFFDF